MRYGKKATLGLCLAIGTVLLSALPLAGTPPQPQRRPNPAKPGRQEMTRYQKLDRSGYQVVAVDLPGNTWLDLEDVNEAGLAVGNYSLFDDPNDLSDIYSFLWHGGRITPLPYPADPGAGVYMYGVNNRGLVIGTLFWTDHFKAAIFDLHHGKWTLLPDVAYQGESFPYSQGLRMNDHGQAVGFACNGAVTVCVGWIWNGSAYSVTAIQVSIGWVGPLAINNRDDVVGQTEDVDGHTHAYLQEGPRITSLDVPGASDTYVNDINDVGEILLDAFFEETGSNQNYLWSKGVLIPLTSPAGAEATYTYGLNNHGDYCGASYFQGAWHGFLASRTSGEESK